MFSWRLPRNRPLIIAHRGSSAIAPENTLAAFRRAIVDGADAIELDVHLTSDGEAVVIHDSLLRRTTGARGRVEEHTLAELQTVSAGRWFSKTFEAENIPTLGEVFDLVKGRIGINIELKSHRAGRKNSRIVERCLEVVEDHHAGTYVLFSSFHHAYIKRIGKLRPDIATGVLLHPLQSITRRMTVLQHAFKPDYIILNGTSIRKPVVANAHELGMLVGEYTVNTQRRLHRAERFDIDAVFTDVPAILRSSASS